MAVNAETLLFFKNEADLSLYLPFEQSVLSQIEGVRIRVQKTQITFANKRNFAAVSYLPVRKAAARPPSYIVITFGLSRRIDSPRIAAAVEPYPCRWTHHVLIASPAEIDGELMAWVREAAAFSAGKR